MLNQMVIVGRLVKEPKLQKAENGSEYVNMTLAVPRTYKNSEGAYDTDFIDCVSWDGIARNISEYCKMGDLLGVKGRVQTDIYEKDGKSQKAMRIVCDKVSFLATSKSDRNNVEEESNDKTKAKSKSNSKEM